MMKTYLLLLLLLPVSLAAQVTPRNLLGTRYSWSDFRSSLLPRDQWKPFPTTPEAWQAALTDSLKSALILRAETAARRGFPSLPASLTLEYVRTANRSRYEEVSFNKRHDLLDMAIAEAIEGKGRFLDFILDGVWSVCEESFWGVPAHIGTQKAGSGLPDVEERTVDLFAAETAAVLALTDYLVGPQLEKISPLVRRRIYVETDQRIFKPVQVPNRYGYLSKKNKVNNWNPWIMSNWLTAGLLLEKDEERRAQMAYSAMNGLDLYLNGLGDDGGTDEGPMYWFAAGGCAFDALETLQSATNGKVDIFSEPLVKNMASYVYKMHISGPYFVDFADADPKMKPDGLLLFRYGQKVKDDTLARFGAWAFGEFGIPRAINSFMRQRQLWDLLTVKAVKQSAPAPFREVEDAWFPDVQVMTARSAKGLYLATHGGHNDESHNHNDVGDFILYANGQPVIIDAGRGTYTANTFSKRRYQLWFTRSQYHNLPIINGFGQKEGRKYEARNVRYQQTPAFSSLSMDISKAFPDSAGLASWNRAVTLDRKAEAVRVSDDYVLGQKPGSLQQVFLTVDDVDHLFPGKITFKGDGHAPLHLRYDHKSWSVRTEEVPLDTQDDQAFKHGWSGKPIRRVVLEQTRPVAKGKATWEFSW